MVPLSSHITWYLLQWTHCFAVTHNVAFYLRQLYISNDNLLVISVSLLAFNSLLLFSQPFVQVGLKADSQTVKSLACHTV